MGNYYGKKYKSFLQFQSSGAGPGSYTPGDGEHHIRNVYFWAHSAYTTHCGRLMYAKRTTQRWDRDPDYWARYFGPSYDSYSGTSSDAGYDGCPNEWVRWTITDMARNWESGAPGTVG